MKRIPLILGVLVLALFLTSGLALTQCERAQLNLPEAPKPMDPPQPQCQMMPKGMGESEMCSLACKELQRFSGPCLCETCIKELGLSDKQVKDLQAIWSTHRKDAIRKQADIRIAEIELDEIMGQETIDFGKAKAKITQVSSLKQDICLDHLSSVEKAQKVLTAEQLVKFKTLKKKCCKESEASKGMMEKCMMEKGK